MKDEDKSKELLLGELKELRGRIAGLERKPSGIDQEGPQDATGRKITDSESAKARKPESVGALAGMAHELNNILTAVIGNIVLAKMYAKPGSEVSDILNEAERASRRAEDLARQLLTVEAGPDAGATVQGELPANRGEVPAQEEAESFFLSGQRRVLVMDDEEIVRNVVERMLNQCGCEAVLTKDGNEMIELYEKALGSFKPFDAVIIDLVVARGLGGREAIKKLLAIDPHAKAIISSGYADDPAMEDYKAFGFRAALAKPYQLDDLNRVLREVITGKEK